MTVTMAQLLLLLWSTQNNVQKLHIATLSLSDCQPA